MIRHHSIILSANRNIANKISIALSIFCSSQLARGDKEHAYRISLYAYEYTYTNRFAHRSRSNCLFLLIFAVGFAFHSSSLENGRLLLPHCRLLDLPPPNSVRSRLSELIEPIAAEQPSRALVSNSGETRAPNIRACLQPW